MTLLPALPMTAIDDAPPTDVELIARSARGDTEALGVLFDRYHADVYRFVARLAGRNPHELDDLVQDTFLELTRSAGRFRGASSFKTWLFGVAANVCRHHVRSRSRRRSILPSRDDWFDDAPASAAGPHELVERRELLERLAGALQELSPPQREAFVACEIEGLPGAEVARALGIAEGTLWRRLHEARTVLSSTMKRIT